MNTDNQTWQEKAEDEVFDILFFNKQGSAIVKTKEIINWIANNKELIGQEEKTKRDGLIAALKARISQLEKLFKSQSISQEGKEEWETFCDTSYYDLWAVRPIGDKDFGSQKLFHVQSKEEAEALKNILNKL